MSETVTVQRAWLRNDALFPMEDPTNGTRWDAGQTKKAELTRWVLNQPVLQRTTDPSDDQPSQKDIDKIAAQNAADEAARAERERNAERIQSLANGKLPVDEAIAQATADTAGAAAAAAGAAAAAPEKA
jgi:hypothetical protein